MSAVEQPHPVKDASQGNVERVTGIVGRLRKVAYRYRAKNWATESSWSRVATWVKRCARSGLAVSFPSPWRGTAHDVRQWVRGGLSWSDAHQGTDYLRTVRSSVRLTPRGAVIILSRKALDRPLPPLPLPPAAPGTAPILDTAGATPPEMIGQKENGFPAAAISNKFGYVIGGREAQVRKYGEHADRLCPTCGRWKFAHKGPVEGLKFPAWQKHHYGKKGRWISKRLRNVEIGVENPVDMGG